MNNKQLSEMIKNLREKKLAEIVGKSPPFNPTHAKGKEESGSPNQYAHHKQVAEAARIAIGNRLGKGTLGNLKKRSEVHKRQGSQSSRYRYLNKNALEEEDIDLGPTATGQNGKEKEKITVNPKDTTASAKTTTIKERKEK